MDYYLLADMTVQIGYELAVAGAETYRVEETMRRVIEAYGTEGQAFAIPNCVAVSFVTPNTKPLTIMKRVGYHGNDLERIEKLNALSRRICAEVPDPETAAQETDPPSRHVYASQYYYTELNAARMLHDLNLRGSEPETEIRKKLEKICEEEKIEPDELQIRAVIEAVNSGLLIITGGPGTGKTTTINTIIRYFEQEEMEILLAAPTGRAAKRMTEATGYEARTITIRGLDLSTR